MNEKDIRKAAVAGAFYPDDPNELRGAVVQYLSQVKPGGRVPKAVIAPHAGYTYSGPVAASVYARFLGSREISRVILLGPSHRVGFYGLATSSAKFFETPLGLVPVDQDVVEQILSLPQVTEIDRAHAQEHSLEVHLPFLQCVLKNFSLVPLVVGETQASEVGAVLEALWGGGETLVVVSADLSHYHEYTEAQKMDAVLQQAIEALDPKIFTRDHTCGYNPVRGLLYAARKKRLTVETIDLRNSGDTVGPKRGPVVGYGAWGFYETE